VIDLTCLRIAGSGPHLVFWMTNGLQYANIDSVKREADKLALTNLMSLHNKFKSFELVKALFDTIFQTNGPVAESDRRMGLLSRRESGPANARPFVLGLPAIPLRL